MHDRAEWERRAGQVAPYDVGMAAAKKSTPAVYRRRRLVALLLLIFVAVLSWFGVTWAMRLLSGGDRVPAETADPAVTQAAPAESAQTAEPAETGASTPEPSESGPAVCTQEDVQLTAVVDASSYVADQRPKLSMKFVNTSDHDCAMDIGTSTQTYTVKSGEDTIWVSSHCQTDKTTQVVLLEQGKEITTPPIEWVRERSALDTCGSDARPAAVGGGAYYSLTVSIGGVTSDPTYFVLE